MQVVVVYFSGSIALLADTIHNFGDACFACQPESVMKSEAKELFIGE
jgi:hypothetical protein